MEYDQSLDPFPQGAPLHPPLELEVSPLHPDGALVSMRGELCLATMADAEARVSGVLTDRPSRLVLDLRELSFLDSTGIRLLLVLHERARAEGFDFSLMLGEGQSSEPRRALKLVGLDERLSHADAREIDSAATLASIAA